MCQINRWWCFMVCAAPLLTSGASALHAQESARGQELRRLLSRTIHYPGIDDPKASLTDLLEQFAKAYNLSFNINEPAFKDANMEEVQKFEVAKQTSIPAMETKLESALKKVLLRVSPSATYIIRDDVIEITTMKAIRKEFFSDRPPGPLPPLISANFNKISLKQAFNELRRQDHSIVLDDRVAEEGGMQVTADLTNVPQDTAVRLLADMAGLKVVPLDNVLYVTSKDNAVVLMKEQETLRQQWLRIKQEHKDATKKTDKTKKAEKSAQDAKSSGSQK